MQSVKNLETSQSNHFIFNYSTNNKFIIDLTALKMEKMFTKLNTLCKSCSENQKIEVFLVDNVDEYLNLTNTKKENFQDWMKGQAEERSKRIYLLRQNTFTKSTPEYIDYFQRVILHELVHVVFNSMYEDKYCHWISEGTATYYSNQLELKKVEKDNIPTISELGQNFVEKGGYTYAGVYVRYLIKQIGEEEFVKLYKAPAKLHHYIYDCYQTKNSFEADAVNDYLESIKQKEHI